jgi:hypothetical protein
MKLKKQETRQVITVDETAKGPFAYFAPVAAKGYEWNAEAVEATSRTWANGDPINQGPWLLDPEGGGRWYAPLEKPGLHRIFARLQTKKNVRGAIKKFADRYGLLGHPKRLVNPQQKPTSTRPRSTWRGLPTFYGISLDDWQQAIDDMALLIKLWDWVREERSDRLSQRVKWNRTRTGVYFEWVSADGHRSRRAVIASKFLGSESQERMLEEWQPGDVIEPARYFLYTEINMHLSGHVSPSLTLNSDKGIYMYPDCLLSALYVLFSLEVAGLVRPPIMCNGCGSYFVPEMSGRSTRKYCGTSCRKRVHYRKRFAFSK